MGGGVAVLSVLFSRKFSVKIVIVSVYSSVYESYKFLALINCEYLVKILSATIITAEVEDKMYSRCLF